MQGILKKELSDDDRQYRYENTVLGRYRFSDNTAASSGNELPAVPSAVAADGSIVDGSVVERAEDGDVNTAVNHNSMSKKSVHFEELDDRMNYYRELAASRRHSQHAILIRKWIRGIRDACSWASIRLLLMDWLFLAILGIGMALASMFVDKVIEHLQTFQLFLLGKSGQTGNLYLDYLCTYLSWLGYTELLVICSAVFVHYVAPQAIGSGIPEMKTVLRGVVLKDFLAPKTLLSKLVGLMFSLGSGIPIGKMGPFVHIASNFANLLSNLVANVDGAYSNECRKSEMLAAACATGVASTFSAPVGGVLFSIEVTTMYFSVRNYWRGFFAAACAATVFGLLRVLVLDTEVTLVAFYPTQFPQHSFQPEELPIFALIGLICGFMGAFFIVIYHKIVMFLRKNPLAKRIFQKNWLIYPITVAFIVATITYPRGFGRFLSGRYKFTKTVLDFFSNCTWTKALHSPDSPHGCGVALLASWTNHEGYGPYNVFLVLFLFTVTFFFLSAICNTLPVPCGMFMPLFVVGAALGRLIGEIVSVIFPNGIPNNLSNQPIFPGIYAVVGAASLTGAITHSVSVAMICCELTGQLIYIIPLMIAVIIANAVCTYLQPSIYDTIIRIKHLPYLPDLPPSNAAIHIYTAEQIMVSPVRYLCRQSTYADIRNVLIDMPRLRSFPVVDDSVSIMLLGSISRRTLLEMLNRQVGDEARKAEASRRIRSAIETIDRHFREQQMSDFTDRPTVSISKDDPPPKLSSPLPIELPKDSKLEVSDKQQQKISAEGVPPDMVQRGLATSALPISSDDFSILTSSRRSGRNYPTAIGRLTRTKSDVTLNRDNVQPKRDTDSQCKSEADVATPSSDTPSSRALFHLTDSQRAESRVARRRSRFVVEPVKRYNSQLPGRPRRNAIFSSATSGTTNNPVEEAHIPDPISRTNSGASTPTKNSVMDSLHYNHQTSITRNINEYVKHAKRRLKHARRKDSVEKVEYDLFGNERCDWELTQLREIVEFDDKQIDPAPFQLVRRTSVYKVHSLFSLLDLNRAYVTDRGRLVGVVALRDLRSAIEKCQNGIPVDVNPAANLNNGDVESGLSTTSGATADDNSSSTPGALIAGDKPLKQLHFTFDDERTANFIKEQLSGYPMEVTLSLRKFSEAALQSPSLITQIERDEMVARREDAENDVLTPMIKVVYSSASVNCLHPPSLTCIQEEIEPVSRQASLKIRSAADGLPMNEMLPLDVGLQPVQQLPIPLLLSAGLTTDTAAPYDELVGRELPTEESVAHAIEYLRRKSLGPEELKTLEEAPLPLSRGEDDDTTA